MVDSQQTILKYYFVGSARIALRENGTITWLLSDHLGSTSGTVSAAGSLVSTMKYTAFGETRGTGSSSTDYRYTGQREEEEIGLYFYKARFFDPALSRFVQADTLIPIVSNVMDWDRYAYSRNNPIRYNDPSGHWVETALDIAFLAYDIYDISTNGLNWENGLSLAADVVGVILPVVTGGGLAVRALTHADDAVKAINTIDNVVDTAKTIDNVMDTAKSGDNLSSFSKIIGDFCSFSADTSVTTLEGETPISSIETGDFVLAWNESEGELGYYPVTAVMEHVDLILSYVTLDGEVIVTTPEHPFYVENLGWLPAGDLLSGMRVSKADGGYGLVWQNVAVNQSMPMYNLTVDVAHTYFVGNEQWLVHNKCASSFQDHHLIPQKFGDHPLVQLGKAGGWNHNSDLNKLPLPTTDYLSKSVNLPKHNGYNGPHYSYSNEYQNMLAEAWELAKKESWSASLAVQALINMAKTSRSQIIKTGMLIAK